MAAKYTHILDMLLFDALFSGKLPHTLTSQSHFEMYKQNSHFYNHSSIVFSAYHGKFSYLFHYPYTW